MSKKKTTMNLTWPAKLGATFVLWGRVVLHVCVSEIHWDGYQLPHIQITTIIIHGSQYESRFLDPNN